jgi:hypothetical protein
MEVVSVVFALFTVGYVLGVWTACLVLRQPQREYEDGAAGRAELALSLLTDRVPALVGVSRVVERT